MTTRKKAQVYQMKPNRDKIVEAILYIISDATFRKQTVTQYEIVKTLFLADRSHLNRYGRPITYDNYKAMKDGPVPSFAYDLLKDGKNFSNLRKPWKCVQDPADRSGKRYLYERLARKPDPDILSMSDARELGSALTIVKTLGFGQIRKLTHEDPAYVDAWEDGDSGRQYPMSYSLLFDKPDDNMAKELAFISQHV